MPRAIFRKTVRAFSILEVVLSASVLSIGMLSMVAVMSSSLAKVLNSQKVIIATELAQEGVELVRNFRDNDLAVGGNGFNRFSDPNKHCFVNWDSAVTVNIDCKSNGAGSPHNNSNRSRYYLQYENGFYKHSSVIEESFSRYVYIDDIQKGNSLNERAVVRSFVYWGDQSTSAYFDPNNNGDPANGTHACTLANKCVFVESFLTSWK